MIQPASPTLPISTARGVDTSRRLQRLLQAAVVLGLHLALLAWLARALVPEVADGLLAPLGVRLVEAPPAPEVQPEPLPPRPPPPKPRVPLPSESPPVVAPPEPVPEPVLAAPLAPAAAPAVAAVELAPSRPPSPPVEAAPARSTPVMATPAAPAPPPPQPIVPARFDADYLANPAPVYPLVARRLREQGTVLLLVQVSAGGDPLQVSVQKSSGHPRLDEAALDAVRRWRFVPARRGDQPVAAPVIVPLVFELDR